jgi:hypothetical protein
MTRITDDDEFELFERQVREELLPKLSGSNYVISIAPSPEHIDIKVAVEVGLAILLNKPLIVMAPEGRVHPEKLLRIADYVVTGDIESDEGRQVMFEKIGRILKQ